MDASEANRVRWAGEAEPFYEVWYAIFVDPATDDGYWIRYTLLNPADDRPEAGATVWFAHTCRRDATRSFAVTQHFRRGDFAVTPGASELRFGSGAGSSSGLGASPGSGAGSNVAPALWTNDAFSGAISGPGHDVRWQLRFDASAGPSDAHFLMPPALRRVSDRRAILTIPRPRAAVSGSIAIDGRTVEIAAAPGHQAHHFGRERAAAWDWAHCAHFAEDESAVVECLSPHLAGGHVKPTFLHLHTRSRVYRCERPTELARNRSASGLGWWHFTGHDGSARIEVDFACDPALVLPFTYHSTAYAPSRCWNTQVADCLVRVLEGEREIVTLRSLGLASAEMHRSNLAELPYET